ncbi:endonuclease [Roseivivax sp. GX 12232]|uniref:endonuclease n=1 Tax=Roseivivax sp. GX 12232 TaxID=2900547 RepID=UPI001E4FFD3D|nr:endonuclease [Roseivivax sp. GX 12232]MCE0504274.1 endonuclease [Roseivivax sp. GX 12232]
MSAERNTVSCQTGCWALAAGVGFVTFVMLLVVGSTGWIGSIFLGGLSFVFLGFLFSWMFCAPLTRPGEVTPGSERGPKTPGTAGVTPGSAGVTPGSTEAPSAPAAQPAAAAAAPAAAGAAQAGTKTGSEAGGVKPSKELPGQKDLSERKGNWSYKGEGGETGPAQGQPIAHGAEAGADKEARTTQSLDPEAPQTKPETLSGARDGKPDNLKEIKGVGPKLEKTLNEFGFYHFDQIAGWTEEEVNWVNQNLTGFKGRVTRDDWVAQAKILASGGDTEFSKRVDKGDVY